MSSAPALCRAWLGGNENVIGSLTADTRQCLVWRRLRALLCGAGPRHPQLQRWPPGRSTWRSHVSFLHMFLNATLNRVCRCRFLVESTDAHLSILSLGAGAQPHLTMPPATATWMSGFLLEAFHIWTSAKPQRPFFFPKALPAYTYIHDALLLPSQTPARLYPQAFLWKRKACPDMPRRLACPAWINSLGLL